MFSGTFLVFLGAICWSLNAPLIKYLSIDSMTVNCLRCLMAGIIFLPRCMKSRIRKDRYFYIQIISFSLNCILVCSALKMTGSAIAVGMQYTAAFWLFLFETIRNRKIEYRKALPIVIIFFGIVAFMCSGGSGKAKGNILAFLSGICFAIMSFSGSRVESSEPLALTCIDCFTAAFISFLIRPTMIMSLLGIETYEIIVIVVLGVVQTGLGYGLYNKGLRKTSPRNASLTAIWEMILGPVWVSLFLNEYPKKSELIGMLLVISGLLVNAMIETADSKKRKMV